MTSFGKRGEGPEEMVSADCFRFISKDSIWTLDANKMRTTRWKIEQNMNNIIPVETIDMDKRTFTRWNRAFWYLTTSVNIDKSGQTEKGNGFTPLIRSRLKIIMKTSHALHWRKRGEASSTIIPKKASWSWQPN